MKRKQRLRLEQGKEKAENVQGRTETKLLDSVGRGQRRKARRADWEDIDEKIGREVGAGLKSRKGRKPSVQDQKAPSGVDCATFDLGSSDVMFEANPDRPKMDMEEEKSRAPEDDGEIL